MTMLRASLALLLPLVGCSYGLRGEIESLRAEIVDTEKRIPPEAPLWIFEGPDRFEQFLDDSSLRVPEFIYLHLARKLHGIRDVDSLAMGEWDRAGCEENPSRFRGRIWRVRGLIAELHAEPIKDPKLPLDVVHAGVFFDPHHRPVLIHVVQKPDVLTLREDTVESSAIFVKWVDYESRSGRRVRAPLFVGKALRRYL
jgi:hypothetical protein